MACGYIEISNDKNILSNRKAELLVDNIQMWKHRIGVICIHLSNLQHGPGIGEENQQMFKFEYKIQV